MTLYMLVTDDEYELPLVVADSVSELARILQITPNAISSAISKSRKNGYRSIYVKVEC